MHLEIQGKRDINDLRVRLDILYIEKEYLMEVTLRGLLEEFEKEYFDGSESHAEMSLQRLAFIAGAISMLSKAEEGCTFKWDNKDDDELILDLMCELAPALNRKPMSPSQN